MNSYLHMLQGYVRIRIKGYGTTRFINICNKRGLHIRNMEQIGEEFELDISVRDFKRIQEFVRKTNVKVAIVSKHGLPFLFWRLSYRKCFIIGAFLCFFWLYYMSNFIWAIKIEGNISITDNMILDYLEEQGIQMGTKLKTVNTESLEKSFRRDFSDITWVSIGQEGTALTIDIKERDVAVYEEETYLASNLYAAHDGVVMSMVVRSGLAQVKIGDEVTQGQLLVDGVLPVTKTDGTIADYNLVNADADVVICYAESYYDEISFYENEKSYTGELFKEYSMRLGNKIYDFHWFYPEYEKAEITESFYQMQLWEYFYLPVWFEVKEHREYEIQRVKKDKTLQEAQLYENLDLFLQTLEEKGVQNIQKDVKISTSGSLLILSGELIFTDSNMLREEINSSIGTELENGQYNSVVDGNER